MVTQYLEEHQSESDGYNDQETKLEDEGETGVAASEELLMIVEDGKEVVDLTQDRKKVSIRRKTFMEVNVLYVVRYLGEDKVMYESC